MYFKWSPKEIGGLFCDNKDEQGLYYWMECLQEKKKLKKLKQGESLMMSYDVI